MEHDAGKDRLPGRQHIIKRPRLTSLLDGCGSRIILLTAPAGYGKTTLLREWLGTRSGRHAWLTASAASTDIASLAVDFAAAAARVLPAADRSLKERLHVTPTPDRDVAGLAGVLEQDLADWPSGSWLVLDDYHLIGERSAAEDFVARIVERTPINLIVASRRRPRWATARELLYGELFEIDQPLLAMNEVEAAQVLGSTASQLRRLVSQAKGWPAVLGLAALVKARRVPEASVPDALHEFFADELFEQADALLQDDLLALSVMPQVVADVSGRVLGVDRAERALNQAINLGFLTASEGSTDLHPLLRHFLREKLATKPDETVHRIVARIGEVLVGLERWDDALALAEEFRMTALLETALDLSFDRMLQEGRVASVARWLELADELGVASPTLDVAAAEVALRRGIRARAEAFALAALRSASDRNIAFRALVVAGKAAYFDDRYDDALNYFRSARDRASLADQLRESLWGLFICLNQLDSDDGLVTLDDFVRQSHGDVDAELRAATGLCISIDRTGDAAQALRRTDAAMHLIERSRDPMIRSSFMNARARALTQTGRYREAFRIAEAEREEARRFRLDFANSSLECTAAMALMGFRHFAAARRALDKAENDAERLGDLHNQVDTAAIRCRLLLATGRPADALAAAKPRWERLPSPVMWSELAACRALAYACLGEGEALQAAVESEDWSSARYPRVTTRFARAIVELKSGSDRAPVAVDEALEAVVESGIIDPMVCAYRAYPPLLKLLGSAVRHRDLIQRVVVSANDLELAARTGLEVDRTLQRSAELSPREREVLRLIEHGLTNKQIASTLYISESTAKVHVRHILEKLGAQSRTEAVALARSRGYAANEAPRV
jgi:LuxR family maltose regulon positive regulatory protein